MSELTTFLLFVLGLVIVVVGSNLFLDTAVRLSRSMGLSEIVIGATLVSIGTTLPELLVSTTAAAGGHSEMALGNAIGSVICNTALIAGFVQCVKPSAIDRKSFGKSSLMFFVSAAVFLIFAILFQGINRAGGIVLIALFMLYSFFMLNKTKTAVIAARNIRTVDRNGIVKDVALLIAEGALMYIGAKFLVDYGSVLALWMGVPESVVSLSLVALGTSLPELLTAVNALRKGHGAISLGNIIGANTMNLLLVSGTSSLIRPLSMPGWMLRIDLPFMVAVVALLCIPALIKGRMMRWQGVALLVCYALYLMYLF